MTLTDLVAWISAHPYGAAVVGVIALGVMVNLVEQTGIKATFYIWYFVVLGAALAMAQVGGNRLYFYAFLLGMITAFAEIIGKFKDEPLKSLKTPHAVFYHLLNGVISVFALKVYFLNIGAPKDDMDAVKAVLTAGLGSMLLMRSKFFNFKVGGEDVSFGPDQIIKVFLTFMEGAIDRVRAQSRIEFVRAKLANIDFDAVLPYCETMLDAAQTLGTLTRERINDRIKALRSSGADKQLKSYSLGFMLLNEMGEDYVAKLFETPSPEWLIKAPAPEKKGDGLRALIPFVGTGKEAMVSYLAYGSSMSTGRFRERLGWSDPESVKFLETTKPRKCLIKGYRLAFNKPAADPMSPDSGYANLIKEPSESVEAVVYQLTKTAVEFLDRTEAGYRREAIKATVDGKEIDADAYIADTTRDGLKPTRAYLSTVLDGAKEHGLSPEYIAQLERTETAPDVPSSLENVREIDAATGVPLMHT